MRSPARRIGRWVAALGLAGLAALASTGAIAQVCSSNQAQLTQAIGDSQSALQRVSASLDGFGRELIGPRTGPIDAGTVVSARSNLDAFISALSEFSSQVRQIGQACGPEFATDAQTLADVVARFEAERTRADTLIADHQALVDSGEPPMSQAEMEAVQRSLAEQGFYQGGADGRFGPGTPEAIRRFQQARGLPVTGYLAGDQRAQLMQPQTAASPAGPTPPVDSGPAAPPGTGLPPAPGSQTASALDPQASQICVQNTTEVNNAIERTRNFRQEVSPRIGEFRAAIRGPRVPAIDAEAGNRTIADVTAYLNALQAFFDQAGAVVGHCDSAFDDSYQTLAGQLDALRTINERLAQLNEDYRALADSGEPAMSEQTMQQVQSGLTALGHYTGAIDAVYGPGTRSAIRAYQGSVGAPETGFLTGDQVAALQRAAAAPQPPAVPEVEVPTPAVPTPPVPEPPIPDAASIPTVDAVSTRASDARSQLGQDLATREPPDPISQVGPGDGRFGDQWWRAHDNLAEGRPQETADQRLALFGAAYLDRGAESASMVDAHLIVGDGFARLGLFGDAAFHFQRAYELWSNLGRDAAGERALLLERLAAARLAQAVANGRVGAGVFDELREMLTEALADAESADAASLRRVILWRLADLHVAAERSPQGSEVIEATQIRYGGD